MDSRLSFDDHVTSVVRACNYHIRVLRHIRHLMDRETTNVIACFIISSRLDYCNAILCGVTNRNVDLLKRVQNSLARVVYQAPYRSRTTQLRHSLHWLSIRQCIQYKIASMTFKVRLYHQPAYLSGLVVEHGQTRSLRSANRNQALLVLPRIKAEIASRAFRVAAPKTWNDLPLDIRITTSIRSFHQ